ncbi:hypothetical protein JCM10207_007283 [Rhodosporidiobolus poonsookiae]
MSSAPLFPPGLSLPSRITFSSAHLVSLVLTHLASSCTASSKSDVTLATKPHFYFELRTVALVSKAFARAAGQILQSNLFFTRGDVQLDQWLAGTRRYDKREGQGSRRNVRVALFEDETFRWTAEGQMMPRKDGKETSTWTLGKAREVLEALRGVECLRSRSWHSLGRHLRSLALFNPLAVPTQTTAKAPFVGFPFRLRNLAVINFASMVHSPQDWGTTFSFLSAGGNLSHVRSIDFENFAFGPSLNATFFPGLAPAADSLKTLELPPMDVNPSSWRLALFALLLRQLERLVIHSASAAWFCEILPYFSPALPGRKVDLEHLAIQHLHLPLGAGFLPPIPSARPNRPDISALDFPDPLEALVATLATWPGPSTRGKEKGASERSLQVLQIGDIRAKAPFGIQGALNRLVQLGASKAWGMVLARASTDDFSEKLTLAEGRRLHELQRRHTVLLDAETDKMKAQLEVLHSLNERWGGKGKGKTVL